MKCNHPKDKIKSIYSENKNKSVICYCCSLCGSFIKWKWFDTSINIIEEVKND